MLEQHQDSLFSIPVLNSATQHAANILLMMSIFFLFLMSSLNLKPPSKVNSRLWFFQEGEFQFLQTADCFSGPALIREVGPDLDRGDLSGHHKTAVSRLAPKFRFVFLGQKHQHPVSLLRSLMMRARLG